MKPILENDSDFDKVSFRDPSGFVIINHGRIFRGINQQQNPKFIALLSAPWYKDLVAAGKIQKSRWVEPEQNHLNQQWSWLEHPKFKFPIYAHEMCSEQIFEAGLLTLKIAQIAFKNGYLLKDASAWNVVYDKGAPIFIDITSFENYNDDTLWLAYGQFCRHFIIPLILHKYLGIDIGKVFLFSRDGISPNKAQKMLGIRSLSSLSSIETIYLPSLIENLSVQLNTKKKRFMLHKSVFESTLFRLEKYIQALRPSALKRNSRWSSYENTRNHYTSIEQIKKFKSVQQAIALTNGPILDLGCNLGEYAIYAASKGLEVVAVDSDEVALNILQAKLKCSLITISNLNIALPTPAIGWKNQEYESFLDKSMGYFELVLCLGLIHHLIVTERIPLEMIITFLNQLTNRFLLIEWVEPNDIKFKALLNLNEQLFEHLTKNEFELQLDRKFKRINSWNINLNRTVYLCEKLH